jgi:hypothetical protein
MIEDKIEDERPMTKAIRYGTFPRRWRIVISFLFMGFLLWFLGHQNGLGQEQEQEVEKWTVESHDLGRYHVANAT